MTQGLIKILLVFYLIITIVSICERKWSMALYWVSASGLQIAILWGMK